MGRRQRIQEEQEARASRKQRLRWVGGFLLIAFALVCLWLLRPNPVREEDRLIRLAAERGVFVFGAHLDGQDFALVEPFLEEAFRDARNHGKRVVFIEELGSIGIPDDTNTKEKPSAALWLAEIAQDPETCRASYQRRMAEMQSGGEKIKRGEFWPSYGPPFGEFTRAGHAFLIRNRDILETFEMEDLAWEDYCDDLRLETIERQACHAYMAGDPDGYEKLEWEAHRGRDIQQGRRDRRLMLQVGRHLEGRDDLVVVTARGVGHWGMVGRYGLKQARRPEWERIFQDDYGLARIDMHRLMGQPLSAQEERHWILAQCPGLMLHSDLMNKGLCGTPREASRKVKDVLEDPALTVQRLRELSDAMKRAHLADEDAACAFVHTWLSDKGFLR